MTTMNVLLKTNESWFHHQIVEFAEMYGLSTWAGAMPTKPEAEEKQISLLQERKQIIINDVVTGKVKVL